MRTPLSLEDIARENRRRHDEEGGVVAEEDGGPLELEVRSRGGGGGAAHGDGVDGVAFVLNSTRHFCFVFSFNLKS